MDFNEKLLEIPPFWSNDRVFFFKYMSASTGKIVLENSTLRWSTPGMLNDPYDVQFDLNIAVNQKLVRELQLEKMWKVFTGKTGGRQLNKLGLFIRETGRRLPKMSKREFRREFSSAIDEGYDRMATVLPSVQEDVRKTMARTKILCLTEDPANTAMWTHYADQQKGVVLVFRSIPSLDSCFGMAEPIRYTDKLPVLLDEEGLSDIGAGLASIDAREQIQKLVFTKGLNWRYEKEWRICAGDGRFKDDPHEDIKFHKEELAGVICGLSISPEDRKDIIGLSKNYPSAELFQARRSSTSFDHEIVPSTA